LTKKQTALVVEDDEGLVKIYRHVLERMNIELLQAGDAQTALDILAHSIPDVLFLDMLLPHTNGVAILDYVAGSRRLQNMRVVIVSSSPEYEWHTHRLPSARFVLKPILPAQIRELALG
jgi:two-component SAPR family response regulator